MFTAWKETTWSQYGAAIDMLENAIRSCPEELWRDRSRTPEYWYVAYHTLFWLDFYLSDPAEGFTPPAPFGLEELDPAGVLPDRPYSQPELLQYLDHGREKCRAVLESLSEEKAGRRIRTGSVDMTVAELLLYNMRHVQHHTGQLNLLQRLVVDTAPGWVGRTRRSLR